ncbi:hypothetical protein DRW03_24390 [Corallococcus sp. H22C18031201]|uniref:hypothetical protein n=1 Tax=Citreicoccus inhibens TaxID=2849499 RepID=UPI000E7731D5|nr:hypothetical protein [Citreicoccus inhibens]MBU8896479.1 hypothetical protein [Citreicoccus inhibens]RJS18802.1 hypothetical protein DRW03_24390 [Corallococcus sp. H22C18031201]
MRIALDTPFLKDGIRSTNFFNGRLLSAEDLSREQAARDAAQERLGRALGEGVAYGLEVGLSLDNSPSTPLVTVQPGLALSRDGEALELLQPVEVSLLQGAVEGAASAAAGSGAFGACSLPGSTYVSGTGIYVLVMAPASGREGRAVASGLGGVQSGCDARQVVAGVCFRLLRLDQDAALTSALASNALTLRNLVAHQCFGTTDPDASSFVTWPFAEPTGGYGLLDALRSRFLTPCDVPLALLHWKDGAGIRFIDMWAARRRVARVGNPLPWLAGPGDRREVEAEAMYLQFQEHIERLRVDAVNPGTVRATDHFAYLPAAGILPLGGYTGTRGFDYLKFFEGLTVRAPINIEGARLPSLLSTARAYPPIELARKELIWLYVVRENQQALSALTGPKPQPYLVFATGHIPYWGDPRFDTSKWNYANYASGGPSADQPGP